MIFLLLFALFGSCGCRDTGQEKRDLDFSEVLTLRKIALAIASYEQANGFLPPPALCDPDGKPLLSWRVLILPQLGEEWLYKQFKLNEPWDSAHNINLLSSMPVWYRQPRLKADTDPYATCYQVFVGQNTLFDPARNINSKKELSADSSKTILIVEAAKRVPWTKPEDLEYDPGKPLPALGGYGPSTVTVVYSNCDSDSFKVNEVETKLRPHIVVEKRAQKAIPKDQQ